MAYYPFRTTHATGEAVDPDDLQVFEPDFTDYTLKASVIDPSAGSLDALYIATASRKVLLFNAGSPAMNVQALNIDTGTLTDTGARPYFMPESAWHSANGRYITTISTIPLSVLIFKDGDLLKRITPDNLSDIFSSPLALSGDGRFVAAIYKTVPTVVYYVRVYEGV